MSPGPEQPRAIHPNQARCRNSFFDRLVDFHDSASKTFIPRPKTVRNVLEFAEASQRLCHERHTGSLTMGAAVDLEKPRRGSKHNVSSQVYVLRYIIAVYCIPLWRGVSVDKFYSSISSSKFLYISPTEGFLHCCLLYYHTHHSYRKKLTKHSTEWRPCGS